MSDLRFLGVPIERHASLGSTNDEALRRAMEGAPEGVVVLADVQTAGRGRQGRGWNDVPGASLAFSVVLRPALPLPRLPLLALAMACSVAEAAEALTGSTYDVKWPNDVLFEGRKVCG
ncbi:MAG TPA: biotin--[acetyl-CoA-carboxylase] ligase, partial [Candidatus Nitrosocosmicus sp.]|nr:biotin--[acetyl-CoA-carboxylase] ligase [Candidatus Nitrosocosmicus sp.]